MVTRSALSIVRNVEYLLIPLFRLTLSFFPSKIKSNLIKEVLSSTREERQGSMMRPTRTVITATAFYGESARGHDNLFSRSQAYMMSREEWK